MTAINNASATSSTTWVGWSQTACDVALPSVTATNPSGVAYMQIYRMRLGLSGKDASRTVQMGIWNTSNSKLANTASFTVAAASSASLTAYQNLASNLLINRNTTSNVRMGFWVSGNSSVYYMSDTTSQTMDIEYDGGSSTSLTTFSYTGTLVSNGSLVGDYTYYTLPTAPASISVVAGQAQASVSWSAPSSNGGTSVTSYTLQRATNSTFTANLVTTTGLTGGSTTVTGLTNGTSYYFRIAAVNAVATAASTTSQFATFGGGTPTAVIPSSGATVPGSPTSLTVSQQAVQNPNGLLLSWSAPASNGGASITSYAVNYSLNSDMSSATSIATGTAGTTYNINNLATGSTYYFQVAATNSVGTGAYSNTANGFTYAVSVTSVGIIKRWDATVGAWTVII